MNIVALQTLFEIFSTRSCKNTRVKIKKNTFSHACLPARTPKTLH
jgi:hypothetical protein